MCLRYGWLPGQVDELEWDVLISVWNEGKRQDGFPIESAEQAYAMRRNWRSYIHGL